VSTYQDGGWWNKKRWKWQVLVKFRYKNPGEFYLLTAEFFPQEEDAELRFDAMWAIYKRMYDVAKDYIIKYKPEHCRATDATAAHKICWDADPMLSRTPVRNSTKWQVVFAQAWKDVNGFTPKIATQERRVILQATDIKISDKLPIGTFHIDYPVLSPSLRGLTGEWNGTSDPIWKDPLTMAINTAAITERLDSDSKHYDLSFLVLAPDERMDTDRKLRWFKTTMQSFKESYPLVYVRKTNKEEYNGKAIYHTRS
jgi:hypothetical protein